MNPENVEGGILILSVSELYSYLEVWNCRNLLYCVWQNDGGLLSTNVMTQVCPVLITFLISFSPLPCQFFLPP